MLIAKMCEMHKIGTGQTEFRVDHTQYVTSAEAGVVSNSRHQLCQTTYKPKRARAPSTVKVE